MFHRLKKLLTIGGTPQGTDRMVYSMRLGNAIEHIDVYLNDKRPNKYKFVYVNGVKEQSFTTRRYLLNLHPGEEITTGMYDKVVSKRFNKDISFKTE